MEEYSSSGRRTPLLAGRGRAAARGSLVRSSSGSRVGASAAASDGTGLAGTAVADADIRAGGSWGLSWEATAGSTTVAGDGGQREVSSTCSSSSSHGVAAAAGTAGGGHQARTLRAAAASSYTSSPDFSATAAASPWFATSPQPQRAPPAGTLGLGTAAAVSEKLRRLWGGRGGASAAATEVDVELQRQQLGGHRGGAARRTVREVVTDDEEEDDEEDSLWFCYCLPQLTHVERLLGWLICFVGGLVISGLCVGSFYDLFRGRSMKFAVAYTLGNCVGLLGTTFLVGPVRQLQGMADPSRLVTSCIFAASLLLTLFFSLFLPLPPLVIVCVCVQWLAYVWYSLSYIPYGQESVLWCLRAVAGRFR